MIAKFTGFALLVAIVAGQHKHDSASSYISFTQSTGNGPSHGNSFGLGLGSSSSLGHGSGGLSYGGSSLGQDQGQSFGGSSHSTGGHHEEHYAHPKYSFKYGVEDKHTGDIKQQEESRDGHVVKGSYSVHEPDGTILVVHYTADKHSGFNAVVQREGHASHPQHSHH